MRVCELNPRAGEDIATCFDNEVDAIVRLVGQHDWYRSAGPRSRYRLWSCLARNRLRVERAG